MIDLNQFFGDLFKHATSAIDLVKQASSSIDFDKANQVLNQQNVKEGIQTGLNIFQKINLWFKTSMGMSLVEIFKLVWHAIVWIFEQIISLLKGIAK
ncbi:MAG: hypothetical protein WC297_02085 [Candidatus Paceibacterota bacterium]|jgi:hypothetical protein